MTARFAINQRSAAAFTIAEVCVAIAVSVFFAVAAFMTNQRLLIALKSQKETVAANTLMQERMERLRTLAYSSLTDLNTVKAFTYYQPTTTEGTAEAAAEAPLGNLTETVTISGDTVATGGAASANTIQWVRNAANPTGSPSANPNTTLFTNYDTAKVDILLTWTGASGRTRTRDLAAIFGKGTAGGSNLKGTP